MEKMKKEGMKISSNTGDHAGRKFSSKAKGGNLSEGLAEKYDCADTHEMYDQSAKNGRMPVGNDRIGGKG